MCPARFSPEPTRSTLRTGSSGRASVPARPIRGSMPSGWRTPVLYASLGTVFDGGPALLRTFATALAPLGGTVVVSTGHTEPADLGPLPANALARRSAPQLQVLDRAALFVTHGGMNSVNEAMRAGVPTLVVPQGADQPLVAGGSSSSVPGRRPAGPRRAVRECRTGAARGGAQAQAVPAARGWSDGELGGSSWLSDPLSPIGAITCFGVLLATILTAAAGWPVHLGTRPAATIARFSISACHGCLPISLLPTATAAMPGCSEPSVTSSF
ncbi:hypothetical protein ABIE33_003367 [Ensifer sp. 4252]